MRYAHFVSPSPRKDVMVPEEPVCFWKKLCESVNLLLRFLFLDDRVLETGVLLVEVQGKVVDEITDVNDSLALPLRMNVSQPVRKPGVHSGAVAVGNNKNSHSSLHGMNQVESCSSKKLSVHSTEDILLLPTFRVFSLILPLPVETPNKYQFRTVDLGTSMIPRFLSSALRSVRGIRAFDCEWLSCVIKKSIPDVV